MAEVTPRLADIDLLVTDFDGVLTDNRVIVSDDGHESVVCTRADGIGCDLLRAAGLPLLILSTETNRVVSVRGEKLGVEVVQGCADKGTAMLDLLSERGLDPGRVMYVGNDVNDLGALRAVGWPVVPADAHPDVVGDARLVTGPPAARACCASWRRRCWAGWADVEVLAIVPARGGSKGIPRKNLVTLLGRPLLWWSVRAALDAETVTRTIISTDDEEIAEAGRAAGAEVPFLRPAELAGDTVLDLPVFEHALRTLADARGLRPRPGGAPAPDLAAAAGRPRRRGGADAGRRPGRRLAAGGHAAGQQPVQDVADRRRRARAAGRDRHPRAVQPAPPGAARGVLADGHARRDAGGHGARAGIDDRPPHPAARDRARPGGRHRRSAVAGGRRGALPPLRPRSAD